LAQAKRDRDAPASLELIVDNAVDERGMMMWTSFAPDVAALFVSALLNCGHESRNTK
jgi:hypothetical protein